ncbi:MAG: DUF1800 domain-containing protein [Rubrivivax sp.]|nr:MAG: DUF1800 domain-containing protein [Rubrivivax sp.]
MELAQATSSTPVAKPATRQEAARFLTQATFGPTDESINHLMSVGYSAWLQEQFAAAPNQTYRKYWDTRTAALRVSTGNSKVIASTSEFNHAFWAKAVKGQDQLRQRVTLALSEIFVVSMQDGCVASNISGTANYMDMLGQRSFGTYRALLEAVTLHPIMGCYLSHLRNQKEDVVTGRVPDENYAREVMQLFSIGLVKLNEDGTPALDAQGRQQDTYTSADVSGLAKVFTGWSFSCPDWPSDGCFRWGVKGDDANYNPERWSLPMRPYAKYHSTDAKKFLSITIPAQAVADPAKSLKEALDGISKHPNVGPFIGKQLIQRLVTSNPSPAYVQRVARAFTYSGGNLQATVTAILMDTEARDMAKAVTTPTFGKVREPLLRISALLRAYNAQSDTGSYLLWSTHDPANGLGQAPVQAPSVFNFFRPGYTPPNSFTSAANLVAPEIQLVNETSSAGYANFLVTALTYGLGSKGYDNRGILNDVRFDYQRNAKNALFGLTKTPVALVEDANQRLMYGTMSAALKSEIVAAVTSVYVGSTRLPQTTEEAAETARRRVMTALMLTAASPEFQVQK